MKSDSLVPAGWAFAYLPELTINGGVFSDGDWVESKDQDPDGDVRLIQLADVGETRFKDRSSRYLTYQKAVELGCTFLEVGDILVARLGEPLGKSCLFPGESKRCVTVVDVCIVRAPRTVVDNKYLMLLLNSPKARTEMARLASGSTRQRISRANLAKIPFEIAPVNEQRRIVARIEDLAARSRAAKEALDAIPPLLERFRQSVLAAAFRGDLTKQWREQNPNVEPDWFDKVTEAGQSSLDTRTKRKYRYWGSGQVAESVDESWETLPSGWQWRRVRELGFDSDSVVQIGPMSMKSNEFAPAGVRVLNVGCVQWGRLELAKCNYLPENRAADFARYSLQAGDVMFTRSGTVGRSAVIPPEVEGSLMTFHLLRVRTDEELYLAKLLLFAFQGSPAVLKQIDRSAMGATRAGFNTKLLEEILLPVPPPNEQAKIIATLEACSEYISSIKADLTSQRRQVETLSQSVLAKAFRGELVPQDPNDEPASVLLERIRAEREAATSSGNGKKRKARA